MARARHRVAPWRGHGGSGRGSGRNGRGGRGEYSSYSQDYGHVGNLLNFKITQRASAVSFTRWLLLTREVISVSHSNFGLNNLISRDGIISEIEGPEIPTEPNPTASQVEFTIWKTDLVYLGKIQKNIRMIGNHALQKYGN